MGNKSIKLSTEAKVLPLPPKKMKSLEDSFSPSSDSTHADTGLCTAQAHALKPRHSPYSEQAPLPSGCYMEGVICPTGLPPVKEYFASRRLLRVLYQVQEQEVMGMLRHQSPAP